MSPALRQYLELERLVLAIDPDSPNADLLRDAMDPLWLQLTAEERDQLDSRGMMVARRFEAISAPLSGVLGTPTPPVPSRIRNEGITVTGWHTVAA